MATTAIRDSRLVIRFSWWERLLVRRATYETPLAAVTEIEVRDRWSPVIGARAGLIVTGLLKVGTWRSPGAVRLVCMKRGLPTLRVVLDRGRSGGGFDELLIGSSHARETQAEFRATRT
ncbi:MULTISPECIES: hypothetical protein [Prauserella]|uniref:hypothetical protein n=1 Tax=Prauserella TaxID=142577 RepID=UPI000DA0A2CD|nr:MULTISPECIES: hypothetical protein [Prauserella]PXY24792.1 hypothetical protein BAY59_22240 [Prauserella coralliicola]